MNKNNKSLNNVQKNELGVEKSSNKNIVNDEKYQSSKQYFDAKLCEGFESTVLTPNLNGNPDVGKLKIMAEFIEAKDIDDFCNKHDISKNILFLSCTVLALNKFTFTMDTLLTAISGDMLGFNNDDGQSRLVKTVPFIISNEDREISIIDFIKFVDKTWKTTIENSFYPYSKIAEKYQLNPEFLYLYNEFLQSDDMGTDNKSNVSEELCCEDSISEDYKIALFVNCFKENVELEIKYNDQLYSEDYIHIFVNSIKSILNQFLDCDVSKYRICDISLLPEIKTQKFSEVELPFIHKRFEKQVSETPDDVALIACDATLTYKQLNEKTNIIANALIDMGVKPKNNILVMLSRDSNLIASILAILKVGCAFIPIDPEYPQERINYIYENSNADYIITDKSGKNSLSIEELLCNDNSENPNVNIDPDDLAYIIYTSGSTGKPKGVMVSHKGICNQITGNPMKNFDSILSISTISFIMSIRDILTGVTNGIRLIFASDSEVKNIMDLIELINNTQPESMTITPSRFLSYLEIDDFCDSIKSFKAIIMGGEVFPVKKFDAIEKYTDATIFNAYGQSEGNFLFPVPLNEMSMDSNNISVGKPLDNSIADVRDIDGKLLPDGVMGELYFGGPSTGKGYYNLNRTDVFIEINGIPYCRSGDYAIKTPDGEFIFKGRIDNLVKLRGLRIEPSEIEYNISCYPNIKENVVVIREINNDKHLCAYYTIDGEVNKNSLKKYLEDKLVNYMVPTAFMQIDGLPRTPNGKINIKALPEPKLDFENVSPANDIEKKLLEMVFEYAYDENFGVTDNLYSLGFTSLSLMKFNASISEVFNINLNIVELLNNPTIRFIANLIDSSESDEKLDELIKSSKDITYYPLMDNQLGVYYECVQNPDEPQYNLPSIVRFDKSIDALKLKEAIIKTIDAYPYLKTRIVSHNGQLMHKRNDSILVDEIPIVEIDEISDEEIEKENVKRFELLHNQLFRAKIYKTNDEIILFFDIHHIITDGESSGMLFKNFANAYNGDKIEKEVFNGYICSLIEEEEKNTEKYADSEKYFHDLLKEDLDSTILTPDLNDDDEFGELKSFSKNIDSQSLKEFCADKRISPNVLFMASTILTLNKYTFSDKTLLTTIFNGRLNSNYYNTQAFLVKTLPIVSINEDRNISIRKFFKQVDEIWKNGIKHCIYPYIKISDEFNLKPEFLYTYNDLENNKIQLNNNVYEINHLNSLETDYKVSFNVYENEGSMELDVLYNDGLYSENYIKTFLESVISVLNKFIKFSSEELDNVRLKEISIVERDIPNVDELEFIDIGEARLNKIFEKQCELNSDKIILTASDGEFTYNDLNEKANRIANALIKKGIEIEDKVMFILKRNSNIVASIFGILKAGAAFIPVDSEYPQDRIEHVLSDSESKFIIFDDVVDRGDLDLSSCSDKLLDINELLKEENTSNPDVDVSPENLAYLIYTSGSTGLPKGVMIEHRNFANYVYPHPRNTFCHELVSNAENENYKVLSLVTVAFDTFLEEMLLPILNGVPVVFADDIQIKNPLELIPLIEKTNANIFDGTPSRLLQYLEIDGLKECIAKFKLFVVGGEAFPKHLYDTLSKVSDGKIINSYGPTETTVACNDKLINQPNVVSVGKPVLNVYEEIMDIDSNPLPPHVLGELYVAGHGVSRAYLNRPEKNAEVFMTINGIKFYRTGDFAKWNENGEVEILGRLDDQIKLRGLRIEIGEIESAIKEFEGIKSLAVVVKKIKGNDHLCAYFTVYEEIKNDGNGYSIDIDNLKEHLNSKLTYYMVPTVYMELDEMPQTLNGKTDLRNLPEPVLITEYVAPENDIEAFFADAFADILSLDKVGVTDNFFEIRGTSLLVTKITLAALNKGYDISYGDVFDNPTPRKLTKFILTDEDSEIARNEESDYDYSKINELLNENTLENFIKSEQHDDDLGDILLTGATGFLGIHILRELLENNEGNIYCLVRSKSNISAEERLKFLLYYYFSNNYEELFKDRIHIIDGDITRYEDFEKLSSYGIDTIFNCAANVKHFSSGTDIEDINYGGVLNGLKFAKLKNSKFVQISTYSVAGESINNFPPEDYLFNERDLYIGQGTENQYVRSKFLAERAILESAIEDNLSVKIMRVGNLMARSDDGEFQINFISNGFVNRLKAFVTLGKMPYSLLSSDDELSPIDVTAKSIVELSKTPKECVVFHPYQHHTICFGDIIDIIKPLGLEIDAVEEEEFDEYLNQAFNDKDKQEGISGLITSAGGGTMKKVWIGAENDYTIQVLYRLGVKWPIISEEYIYKFIEYLNDLAFF